MKVIFFLLLLLFHTAFQIFGEPKVLRLAVFQLEPFMMEDPLSKAACGAVIDYWKEYIGPRLGYGIEVVGLFPSNRVMSMLEQGDIDIAPLFTKIPERELKFLFPQNHFYEVQACLMVLPDNPIREIKNQEDLFGLRVGYLEGAFIPPIMVHPRITIELITNTEYREINYKKLIYGRIDAWLDINRMSLQYFLKNNRYEENVRLVNLPTEKSKLYSIFRKTLQGEQLIKEYEPVNLEGIRSGIFESFLKRYLE